MSVTLLPFSATPPSKRVECTIEDVELTGDHTPLVDSVRVHCGRCSRKVEAFGNSESSAKYALSRLSKSCPLGQHNFYFYPGLE